MGDNVGFVIFFPINPLHLANVVLSIEKQNIVENKFLAC
jgi:hypothetical protein